MGLNALDFLIIGIYLIGVTAFGLHFRSRDRSLKTVTCRGGLFPSPLSPPKPAP